jgi:hypothetical protein
MMAASAAEVYATIGGKKKNLFVTIVVLITINRVQLR